MNGGARWKQVIEPADHDWQLRANCLGLPKSLFYPARGDSLTEPRAVCAGCVVREQCLEYALVNGIEHGLWGGKSERQRRAMRRERKAAG